MLLQETIGGHYPIWNQFKPFIWRIATVTISRDEMTLDIAKYVGEVFRIGTVGSLDHSKALERRLTSCLHEVHKLVYLKERQEGIQEPTQVTIHQTYKRRSPRRHVRGGSLSRHR